MKRKAYSGLVTSRPPKEIPGEPLEASLQELSSGNPTLMVPQDDSAISDRLRTILLYDAALTPRDMPGSYGIPSWALDTARMMRAYQVSKDQLPEDEPLASHERNRIRELLGAYAYKPVQSDAAKMRINFATGADYGLSNRSLANIELDSWESVVDFASKLAKIAKDERPTPPPSSGNDEDSGDGGDDEDDSDDYDEDSSDYEYGKSLAPEALPKNDQDEGRFNRNPKLEVHGDPWTPSSIPEPVHADTKPGRLENEKPDILPMRNVRKLGFRKRPEMEGSFPSKWHRQLIDGKIFKGAPMRGGMKGRGTIMVDMSASMSWTPEDFEKLLVTLPECTVYGYAGWGGGKSGRLVLLADRGRAATIEAVTEWNISKGSNIIDVHALQFLGKMPKPRIWISDGGVTGCYDDQTPYIVALCDEARIRGQITRVRYAHQVKDAMKH